MELAGSHAIHRPSPRTDTSSRLPGSVAIWTSGDLCHPVSRTVSLSSALDDNRPDISPDGKKIAFETRRVEGSQIWVANIDGTQPNAVSMARQTFRGVPAGRRTVVGSSSNRANKIEAALSRRCYGRTAEPGGSRWILPSWSRNGNTDFSRDGVTWRIAMNGNQPVGQEVQIAEHRTYAVESPNGTTLDDWNPDIGAVFARPVAWGPRPASP